MSEHAIGSYFPRGEEFIDEIRAERNAMRAKRPGHPIVVWGGDRGLPVEQPARHADWGAWVTHLEWTVVYRVFTEEARLLYVGISHRPDVRYAEHIAASPFIVYAAMIHERWFSSRSAALDGEENTIAHLSPPYNVHARSESGGPIKELALDTPAGRTWHPHERGRRQERDATRVRAAVGVHSRAVCCWHCATATELRKELEGVSQGRRRLDPSISYVVCPSWSPAEPSSRSRLASGRSG